MKSLIAFARVLVSEAGERCGISTVRDQKTITERFEHEGLSFLTITLPAFGKDLQKGLDDGKVAHDMFAGFRRHAGLPRFLGGFLELVFDRSSGLLLDEPSVVAIQALRQLTLAFGKVRIDCSDARVAKAIAGYVECEKGVRHADLDFPLYREEFIRVGTLLCGGLFSRLDRMVQEETLVPKHGSGSTADGLLGNAKYDNREWTERLDRVFPVMDWLIPTYRHLEVLDRVHVLEPREERPVKVITVPKTLKTPRIIAMEPTCMMFVQQALHEQVQVLLKRDEILSRLADYSSQLPNQELARRGSRDGTLATLDLSEASDRVSNQHVRALLSPWPSLAEAVDACRSRKADVPGYGVLRLAKFASMGSALCFPMEAFVFTTIVFLGIQDALGRPLTRRDIKSFHGKVRVYGDDIIVPVHMVHPVMKRLASFGMRVNTDKSFWTGKFRESCGADFYDGTDVSVVRVKTEIPTSLKHVRELESTVSLRNLLWDRGWYKTADYLDEIIGKVLPVYPAVPRRSPALGRWSHLPIQAEKTHPHLQTPLLKACVVESVPSTSKVSGYGALLKFFLKRGIKPPDDKRHLERAGRAGSARIKTRWVSAV